MPSVSAVLSIVESVLGDLTRFFLIQIVFEESSELADMGKIVLVPKDPDGEVIGNNAIELLQKLEPFTHWNNIAGTCEEPVVFNDKEWVVGDGDDSWAVGIDFKHGGFYIWLRHFK